MQKSALLLVTAALSAALPSWGQAPGAGGGRGGANPPEEGIPVTNALVIAKCSPCHTKDDKGNLTRISYERSTPEGWEEAIKRMVRLNGVELAPADARQILKYLSTYHGLSPEEAKPVMYMAEHRIIDEAVPNENVRGTCMNCHALGRAFSWRRSRDDWRLLTNMHLAFFPQAEAAFRRNFSGGGGGGAGAAAGGGRGQAGGATADAGAGRGAAPQTTNTPATAPAGTPPAAAPPPPPPPPPGAAAVTVDSGAPPAGGGGPAPVDQALDFLARSYSLHSPEWSAWRARMRAPRISGRWLVSAYITGRGKYFGEMVLERGAADDEFTTTINLQPVKGGPAIKHTGTGLVYAGYSWRGRSKPGAGAASTPDDLAHEMRQVMWISPDQLTAEGRWFWGEYQEFGVDVKMERASDGPMLVGTDLTSLKTGATGVSVKILGDRLPADLAAADLDFGTGVTVRRISAHTPTSIVAEVDVAGDAVPGKRDIAYRRSVLSGVIAVYDKVDYIKVMPQSTIARLGSEKHPKGYQQFEAIAYQRGADGKTYTADDVELGAIDVTWKVEEFYAVYGDDDKEFVGVLSPTGFFTPNSDGPNPQRKFGRNNYGDIWVVATAKNEKDKDGNLLVGRSYLVVTVPMYIRWDQPEVGQ